EWAAEVILVQPGHNHTLAAIRERVARGREVGVEELPFVDADDFRVGVHRLDELVRAADVLRLDPHLAVRDDVVLAVTVVDDRFEDLDLLAGDLRAPEPANQLLALPTEHAAGDDFDPAV